MCLGKAWEGGEKAAIALKEKKMIKELFFGVRFIYLWFLLIVVFSRSFIKFAHIVYL